MAAGILKGILEAQSPGFRTLPRPCQPSGGQRQSHPVVWGGDGSPSPAAPPVRCRGASFLIGDPQRSPAGRPRRPRTGVAVGRQPLRLLAAGPGPPRLRTGPPLGLPHLLRWPVRAGDHLLLKPWVRLGWDAFVGLLRRVWEQFRRIVHGKVRTPV